MGVVFRLTLRQLLRGKRPVLLALIPLAPVVIALGYALSGTGTRSDAYAAIAETVYLPIALAVVALVLGASAIGDEREDGTIVYIATTPLSRRAIAAAKALAAWVAVSAICVPGLLLSLVFVFGGQTTAGDVIRAVTAILLCAACYVSVFGLLAVLARRPVLLGFLYVVLWEGSIATFAPSADRLSIAAYGRTIVAHGLPGAREFNVPPTSTLTALVVLVVVTVLAVLYGGHRLARVELP